MPKTRKEKNMGDIAAAGADLQTRSVAVAMDKGALANGANTRNGIVSQSTQSDGSMDIEQGPTMNSEDKTYSLKLYRRTLHPALLIACRTEPSSEGQERMVLEALMAPLHSLDQTGLNCSNGFASWILGTSLTQRQQITLRRQWVGATTLLARVMKAFSLQWG